MSSFGSVGGGSYNSYKDVAASLSLDSTDHANILMVDSSGGLVTITLPDDLDAGFWCQLRLIEETGGVTIALGGTSTLVL